MTLCSKQDAIEFLAELVANALDEDPSIRWIEILLDSKASISDLKTLYRAMSLMGRDDAMRHLQERIECLEQRKNRSDEINRLADKLKDILGE